MDIFVALIIIGVVMLVLVSAAGIIYYISNTSKKRASHKSLPKGADSSEFAKLLQDKYRAERDSGEFERPNIF